MHAKFIALVAILLGANIVAAQPVTFISMDRSVHAKSTSFSPKQSVTKSEAKAARMDVVVNNFEKIDANNDGVVTRNELRAYALSIRRHVPMT